MKPFTIFPDKKNMPICLCKKDNVKIWYTQKILEYTPTYIALLVVSAVTLKSQKLGKYIIYLFFGISGDYITINYILKSDFDVLNTM